MIAAGCVREVVSSYVGAERLVPIGPAYRKAVESGEVGLREVDEGIYVQALRAAAQMLPFAPWVGGVGTDLPGLNRDLVEIEDPFGGPPVLAVKALPIDVALIHADAADAFGNVQHRGTGFTDRLHSQAAALTVVQVERVISNEAVRQRPWLTSIPDADIVVRAPGGAHPYSSPGHFVEDEESILEYVAAVRAGGQELTDWLARYVYECKDHFEYLDRIGLRRLFANAERA
jgi:glutaconate CoA-transferase subunit A